MKTKKTLMKTGVRRTLLLLLLFASFGLTGLSQITQYGVGALVNNTTGVLNSAFGYNALWSNTSGSYNTGIGHEALFSNTTGMRNTAIGLWTLEDNTTGYSNTATGSSALQKNTTGYYNTATGSDALYENYSGYRNTANGYASLGGNTTGNYNTAIGAVALATNNNGDYNTAVGASSLGLNRHGTNNTASGYQSLFYNETGSFNTANGNQSLYSNWYGDYNTAIGAEALYSNTMGDNNTANGYYALRSNTTGSNNTANGNYALSLNTTGSYNTATGHFAMRDNTAGNYNTAHGSFALFNNITGTQNTALGYAAGFFSPDNISNATSLGNLAYATASNRVRIGNTSVTQIGGQVSWSTLSDGRFKKNITDNVPGIEFIQQLNPVSYNVDNSAYEKHSGFTLEGTDMDEIAKAEWKKQLKTNEMIVYTGFIAQEVEEIVKKGKYNFSAIVAPENEKDHYSIRYAEFVVPLVKATQQQQQKLEEQTAKIEQLENEIAVLKQLVKSLAENSNLNQEISVPESPVKCYPNPNKGMIYVEIENEKQESTEIKVYDISGNLVCTKKAISNQEVDLSSQPNGTYIIKTQIGSKVYQNKVLLQK